MYHASIKNFFFLCQLCILIFARERRHLKCYSRMLALSTIWREVYWLIRSGEGTISQEIPNDSTYFSPALGMLIKSWQSFQAKKQIIHFFLKPCVHLSTWLKNVRTVIDIMQCFIHNKIFSPFLTRNTNLHWTQSHLFNGGHNFVVFVHVGHLCIQAPGHTIIDQSG